jgi:hypothetical protein
MAEPIEIRVVTLDGGSATGGTGAGPPVPAAGGQAGTRPSIVMQQAADSAAATPPEPAGGTRPGRAAGRAPFDPALEAMRRINRQDREASVRQEMERLSPAVAETGAGASAAATAGRGIAGRIAVAAGPAGVALGAVAVAAGLVVAAFKRAADAFLERAKELEGFSPQIAAAGARAEVRTIGADIREAGVLGPGLSRLVDAQSRLDIAIRDVLLPIKEVVLNVVAPLMEFMADMTEKIRDAILGIDNLIQAAPDLIRAAFAGDIEGFQKRWDKMIEEARRELGQGRNAADDWLDQIFQLGRPGSMPNHPRSPDPLSQLGDQALNIPAFGGL